MKRLKSNLRLSMRMAVLIPIVVISILFLPIAPVQALPVMMALKTDLVWGDYRCPGESSDPQGPFLVVDQDGDGLLDMGDTLRYRTCIVNTGTTDAGQVYFTDTIDANTTLEADSIRTTPIARHDGYETSYETLLIVPVDNGVLANDDDPDGTTPVLTIDGYDSFSANGGVVTLSTDGSFNYQPPWFFIGTDSFSYTVMDSDGNLDPATVFISVSPFFDSTDQNTSAGKALLKVVRSLGISLFSSFKGLSAFASGEYIILYLDDLNAAQVVEVNFDVTMDDSIPSNTTQICNQGLLTGANFIDTLTDDETVGGSKDPTCTPVQRGTGTIVIHKVTQPGGGTGFEFTDIIAATTTFTLDDGLSQTYTNVPVDSYTVTEHDPGPAYHLVDLACDDPDGGSNINLETRTASIDLDEAETITCTFTNDKVYWVYLPLVHKNYPVEAIYVRASPGSDSNPGTMALPVATISRGLVLARQSGAKIVKVSAGTYNEIIEIEDGINIQGGYDNNWVFGDYQDPDHKVTILGSYHSGDGQHLTVRARDLTRVTTLSDLVIIGPDVSPSPSSSARSTYGVHVTNSDKLVLERVRIEAGEAAAGEAGQDGTSAPSYSAINGAHGGNAGSFSTSCDDVTRGAGGAPGGGGARGGGAGGAGGTMDTDCGTFNICGFDSNCDAEPGINGNNAGIYGSSYGHGGLGGAGLEICGEGLSGEDGRTLDGAGGVGGTRSGSILAGYWHPSDNAVDGSLGEDGTGGGGGGGSGGCDIGTDSYGAGGGGGGEGGQKAPTTGKKGLDGGTSFGVFIRNSQVELIDVHISLGVGGDGGEGGGGGTGQPGGTGGLGGNAAGNAKAGGEGGNGGVGGDSGGGGGGAGGSAVGIFTNVPINIDQVTFSGGTAGQGGAGGLGDASPSTDGGNGEDGLVATYILQ